MKRILERGKEKEVPIAPFLSCMKILGKRKRLIAGILVMALLFVSCGATSQEKKETHKIVLEGVSNARDLGGYIGANGKKVRKKKLIRCGNLHEATKKDQDKLKKKYQVAKVIDFRSASVRKKYPDVKMKGIKNQWIPVFGPDTKFLTFENAAKNAAQQTGIWPQGNDAEKLKIKTENIGNVEQVLGQNYASLVTEPHSIKAYRKFFNILLKNKNGAVLWHCTAGKDRTGVAAILVLSALGVKERTILDDYLKTNSYIKTDMEDLKNQLAAIGADETIQNNACLSIGVSKSWGESIFATITSEYGSMDHYLKKEMKLDKKKIKKLRKMYLES